MRRSSRRSRRRWRRRTARWTGRHARSISTGRHAYTAALARPEWATQRPPPAFRTWWALAAQATPDVRATQIERRRAFLEAELDRERATLRDLDSFTGPAAAAGRQIVDLVIRQFETELRWLDDVSNAPLAGPG